MKKKTMNITELIKFLRPLTTEQRERVEAEM